MEFHLYQDSRKFEDDFLIITYGIPPLKKSAEFQPYFTGDYRYSWASFQASEFPPLNTHNRPFPPIITGVSAEQF